MEPPNELFKEKDSEEKMEREVLCAEKVIAVNKVQNASTEAGDRGKGTVVNAGQNYFAGDG